ncbi:MAG: selenium-binding family protein [Verrucomicrobiales bacterium]|nr:selenium-binding family protein [Verrucomicrobiales bacterium]
MNSSSFFAAALCGGALLAGMSARADETCSSPYLARIEGQEEFLYVWTLGVEGQGDGSDKLVVVDVKPGSPAYGQVIYSSSVGGRHEAHHGGFTDDRRRLWLAGLETSKIFIFDVHSEPAQPRLVKTIEDFETATGGAVGPHGAYALPGRVLVPCLSNATDRGGRTALVEYSNEGDYITTHWLPTQDTACRIPGAEFADGYDYDARVLPRKNVMLTTSFTGWKNYTRDFGDLVNDPEAMKQFGGSMVLWNFHSRRPRKVFNVPGAPLEIRWAWGKKNNYAFTATALTSKLWLCFEDKKGEWQVREVATIGQGGVLPVDISLSADDRTLFVDSFGDGKCRVFDVKNPVRPRLIHEKQIGRQLNMVSQSWDGKRLYFSSSLLARWDKGGDDNEQFVRAYAWDGQELTPAFELNFAALELGRPHHMLFGSTKVGK